MSNLSKKGVIALTGNIGSGKSLVGQLIQDLGYPFLDADQIVHQAYQKDSEIYAQLWQMFSGNLNSKHIQEIIFNDCQMKEKLENLIHPYVFKKIQQFIEQHEGLIFIEIPLLFEVNWQNFFDRSLLVTCPEEISDYRLQKYRKMNLEQIKIRRQNQMSQDKKIALADLIIDNHGSKEELVNQINKIIGGLKDEFMCQ